MGWIGKIRRAFDRLLGLYGLFTSEFGRLLLAPVFGIVTAALGVLQGIPWMWVAVGGAIGFAALSHGLLRFDEWVERTKSRRQAYHQTTVDRN